MGSAAVDVSNKQPVRRSSHQSTASSAMTEDASISASAVTITPPSTRTQSLAPLSGSSSAAAEETLFGSSLPPSFASPCLHDPSRASAPSAQQASSAPAGTIHRGDANSTMVAKNRRTQSEATTNTRPEDNDTSSARSRQCKDANGFTSPALRRERESMVRGTAATRSNASGRNSNKFGRGPLASTSSVVDRRLLDKYERVNSEIERVVRSTQAEMNSETGDLLKQVRSELRKAKRSSSLMIQSQRELLEKMERQEHSGLRRLFTLNREHKMEKLRHKLSEKLSQAAVVDEELQRLERQSVSLTRMSFGSVCGALEVDELSILEREREDILTNLITSAGMSDAQELHSRLALFSSEKRACECAMKQVEHCETLYRKALHLLRIALSTIVVPTYTGSLKEFVLGPYPLAVEAGQLIDAASRSIQPESRRRYSAYTPELSIVRPPKFPQQMIDFAKRGARSNFDPSNSSAIEAIRKLRSSENVVILMQRIVIQKLELIEKWRRDVERELDRAESGYRKMDAQLQEKMVALTHAVAA